MLEVLQLKTRVTFEGKEDKRHTHARTQSSSHASQWKTRADLLQCKGCGRRMHCGVAPKPDRNPRTLCWFAAQTGGCRAQRETRRPWASRCKCRCVQKVLIGDADSQVRINASASSAVALRVRQNPARPPKLMARSGASCVTPRRLQDDAGTPAGCVPMPACELRRMIERKRAIVAQEKRQGKARATSWPVGAHAFQHLGSFGVSPFANAVVAQARCLTWIVLSHRLAV